MSRKLALVIGNSEYQDARLARLKSPALDAYDFAGVLRAPEMGAFDEVTALFNEVETNVFPLEMGKAVKPGIYASAPPVNSIILLASSIGSSANGNL
jgi:hypothetical protein